MALCMKYEMEDLVFEKAYLRVNATGHVAKPLVTVNVYSSEAAVQAGRAPLTQIPFGEHDIDPEKPTGPQVYDIVKRYLPDARDA